MAMMSIERPLAVVSITWLTAAEGGRRSGPPTAEVYMATCVFPYGDEHELYLDWPCDVDPTLSILIQMIGSGEAAETVANIGFLVPELAAPHLHDGAVIDILEGRQIVGRAIVRNLIS